MIKSWEIKVVPMCDIKPMPDNPRTISDSSLAALEASIARFGYVEPIVWNEATGHIVGGHQRYGILKGKGVQEATVVAVQFEEYAEFAANMTLNNPKVEGTWDDPIVSLLQHLETEDDELFRSLRMDKLKAALDKPQPEDKGDDSPEGIEVEGDEEESSFDTACPCCGHEWNIEPKDVVVEG